MLAVLQEERDSLAGTQKQPLVSTLQDVLPEMERQARALGGDALILREVGFEVNVAGPFAGNVTSSYGSAFQKVQHQATVIRYVDNGEDQPRTSQK